MDTFPYKDRGLEKDPPPHRSQWRLRRIGVMKHQGNLTTTSSKYYCHLNYMELDRLTSTVSIMPPSAVTLTFDLLSENLMSMSPGPGTRGLILVKLAQTVMNVLHSRDFLVITCCDLDL